MRRELRALRNSKTAQKGGVMIVPRMGSPEAWEAEAEEHQRALMGLTMEEHNGAEVREPEAGALREGNSCREIGAS